MNIIAGEPIRGRHQNEGERGLCRTITQTIETGPCEFRPTIAVIAKDIFRCEVPIRMLGDPRIKTRELLLNGLTALLPRGRDAAQPTEQLRRLRHRVHHGTDLRTRAEFSLLLHRLRQHRRTPIVLVGVLFGEVRPRGRLRTA